MSEPWAGRDVGHPRNWSRRGFLTLAGVTVAGACSACGTEPLTEAWPRGTDSLPGRHVWGHLVPQGLPLSEAPDLHYGSERPLTYAPAGTSQRELIHEQLRQARAAGLTGMQILLLESVNHGSDFVTDWMAVCEEAQEADEVFRIAPCIQATSSRGAERLIREYVRAAREHSAAALIADSLVIWVYDARAITAQAWRQCRHNLERDGIDVYLIAELRTASSQYGNTLNRDALEPYGELFEAVWLFDDHGHLIMSDLAEWVREHRMAFAGGVLPGYNRETPRGGYVDARGTHLWRQQWELQSSVAASWATVITWNDVVEHTAVQPTSDWGTTRSDLTAFYAGRFRGESLPETAPQLYVTTAQYVVAGEAILAEALVINSSPAPVGVTVRLVDERGTQLLEGPAVRVAAGEVGAASIENAPPLTPRTAVYAVAELTDTGERRTLSVQSAPVLVYAPGDSAVPAPGRRTYYSVAASGMAAFEDLVAEPGTEQIDELARGSRLVLREPAAAVEILHNTWPAGLALESSRVSHSDPPEYLVGKQRVSTPRHGFTLARVVTGSDRIAYSAPVYRPPEGST